MASRSSAFGVGHRCRERYDPRLDAHVEAARKVPREAVHPFGNGRAVAGIGERLGTAGRPVAVAHGRPLLEPRDVLERGELGAEGVGASVQEGETVIDRPAIDAPRGTAAADAPCALEHLRAHAAALKGACQRESSHAAAHDDDLVRHDVDGRSNGTV